MQEQEGATASDFAKTQEHFRCSALLDGGNGNISSRSLKNRNITIEPSSPNNKATPSKVQLKTLSDDEDAMEEKVEKELTNDDDDNNNNTRDIIIPSNNNNNNGFDIIDPQKAHTLEWKVPKTGMLEIETIYFRKRPLLTDREFKSFLQEVRCQNSEMLKLEMLHMSCQGKFYLSVAMIGTLAKEFETIQISYDSEYKPL